MEHGSHQTRKETLEMRKRKPLALAGCGSASETLTPAHAIAATGTTCSKMSSDDIKECIVTLSDTRKVDCVVYSGYKQGGLSCDWRHVSGADKEPAR